MFYYLQLVLPHLFSLEPQVLKSIEYNSPASQGEEHPIRRALSELIHTGGNGIWPPKATYQETWPSALRPYHHIFQSLADSIPVVEASLDDGHNRTVIDAFRHRLRSELSEKVDLQTVEAELTNDRENFSPRAWMGFFSCIAYTRHAYRWGVAPIVREAQNELSLDFPEQLDVPWSILQRHFGVTSSGGNLTSNIFYAVNERKEMEYSCTVGMSEDHRRTEQINALLFYNLEERAFPMYQMMASAIENLEAGNSSRAAMELNTANKHLTKCFKFFYENLVNHQVSQQLWMAYVQGFHGWTLDGIDGVSGGQSLIIRALDAFLGIRPWPTSEVESLHLPWWQRNWLEAMRSYDIRRVASSDAEVTQELDHMLRQLRSWRMGHMRRMKAYEGVARPERKKMTAGKSIVEADRAPDEEAMVKHLTEQLSTRLAETK